MKTALSLLALVCGTALAQHAPRPVPDTATLPRVVSPNHTPSAQLAGPATIGGRIPGSAVAVVDANGKTIGRYIGDALILPYAGELIAMQLQPDWNDTLGKPNSGGFSWTRYGLFYVSTDCSGTPYFWTASYGTRYNGVTVNDGGQFYAYIGEPAKAQAVTIQSYYDFTAANCHPYTAPTQPFMALSTVVALGRLGTPPFFLR
jgi:hypothetical protein